MPVALDTNLLLLLVVGSVKRGAVHSVPGTKQYRADDFDLLLDEVIGSDLLITLPNVLTEVSNLIPRSLSGSDRSMARVVLRALTTRMEERYVESSKASARKEFLWLGLTDAAWLCLSETRAVIWTDDHDLYSAALSCNLDSRMFTHLRSERGHL